ncbi:MAG: hypothetical protein HYZ94_00920 [Candidatus Omnitrophica bacterium]|nr:hypothetical protein [Candidatus Omnitrophota bacterium]
MPNSTGLYIGTEHVDIATLSGSFHRPQIVSFAQAKLPEHVAWRSQVRVEGQASTEPAPATLKTEEPMIACIRNILEKLALSAPQLYAGLPAESVVIRYFQMPAIPLHERKSAIAFEAKKYLPFKLEELITDFQATVRRADPALMRVMFFGIKRVSSFLYSELFRSCSVTPLCLEPAPLSIMRLLRSNKQLEAEEVAVLLLMEHDTATINIARNDLLYLSRNVTITPQGSAGENLLDDLLDALVNETRISTDYYRRRFLGEPAVTKVLVFGQTLDAGRLQELSKSLDLPVQMGTGIGRSAAEQPIPAGLAVAAGLALRAMEKAEGINLLAPELRSQGQGLLRPLAIEAAACGLLLALWYGFSVADLQSWGQKVSQLREQQAQPGQVSRGAAVAELQKILAAHEKEYRLLQSFAQQKAKPSTLLQRLSALMPESAWLRHALLRTTLKEPARVGAPADRRSILRLAGSVFADNRDLELQAANQFLATLRRDSLFRSFFSEFSLDSVQRARFGEEAVTGFEMTCASHPDGLKLEEEGGRQGGRRTRR